MELLITLPIFGLLLMGLLEFSLLFFARGDLVEACRAGARTGTTQGATDTDVQDEVLDHLSPRLQAGAQVVSDCGVNAGDVVSVQVQTPMSAACPDLLWPIGFSLRNRYLSCETRMLKE